MPTISQTKFAQLKQNYQELKASLLKENIQNTLMGGPMDSFKETASFQAAKAAKESKLKELKKILENIAILPDNVPGDTIILGKWFSLENPLQKMRFRLVDSLEADPQNKLLSIDSPLGQLVLNKKQGEQFEFNQLKYLITKVE
ncbi:MAG: GreA/GreB family elongation factor [bacterium]